MSSTYRCVVDVVYLQMCNVVDVVEGCSLEAGKVIVVKTEHSKIQKSWDRNM